MVLVRYAVCSAVLLALSAAADAQTATGVPNAMQGFSQNREQPVKIEAATLEVREKDKLATFSGNVNLTQGDTNLKCKLLVVHYEQDLKKPAMTAATATPGSKSEQRISKLEAKGGVVVTQKEQTATGDSGLFDMRSNTVTLLGNVVVTQGQNVLRGERLVVDLTTGVSRVESGSSGQGRVQGLFLPGSVKDKPDGKSDAKSDSKADTKSEAKPRPAQPTRSN